jgi:tetratricopeptide (TPR) repeat protein
VKEDDDPGKVKENATLDEAKAAYGRAEKYLRLNPTDYLGSAAQFFAVANQYRDQKDVAFKAISKAQELQAKGQKAKEGDDLKSRLSELPTWQRYLVEGETMLENGQIDAAMKKFEAASRLEPKGEVFNKLGHAHFKKAQQQRDEYTEAYLEAYQAYRRAGSSREKSKASRQARAARTIADKARKSYSEARKHFEAALRKNDNLDLDSEFHVGLCNWSQVRPLTNSTKPNPMDIHYRNAQKIFGNIMVTYYDKLDSTMDRTLYATAENYLSDTQLAAVERQIERRKAAADRMRDSAGSGTEEEGPSELADMNRKQIQSHIADVNKELAAAQEKMDLAQRLGKFDMDLMRKINDLRRQIQQAEDELLRR